MIPFGAKIGMNIRVGTLLGQGKVKLAKKIRNYCIMFSLGLNCIVLPCLYLFRN